MTQLKFRTPRRWTALLTTSLFGLTLVVSQGTVNAQEEGCHGSTATIVGTPASELIPGSDRPDVIVGLGGDDTIFGFAGDDLICGGDGVDDISGDGDNDHIYGDGGGDTMDGGAGDDFVKGDAGNDTIGGSAGADSVYGDAGQDTIEEPANDRDQNVLSGGPGNDLSIKGGKGKDEISGEGGNDLFLIGRDGDDNISGGEGKDGLFGDDDGDSLDGGSDSDVLEGGDGEDTMLGGTGADVLEGGLGADGVQGEGGNDDLAEPKNDIAKNILFGDSGNDVSIVGGEGDDHINGGPGNEVFLFGRGGNDFITGKTGKDEMLGGDGKDQMLGGDGADKMTGEHGDDSLTGGAGPDQMFGEKGVDDCVGGGGSDSCNGGLPGTPTPSPSDPDTCSKDTEKIKNCKRAKEAITGTLDYTSTQTYPPQNGVTTISATFNLRTRSNRNGCCVDDGTTFAIQYSRNYQWTDVDQCSHSGTWDGFGEGLIGFGGGVVEKGEPNYSGNARTREVYVGWENRHTVDMEYTYSGNETGTGAGCSGGGYSVDHDPQTTSLDAEDVYGACAGHSLSPFFEFKGANKNSTTMNLSCTRTDGDQTWTLDGTVHVSS